MPEVSPNLRFNIVHKNLEIYHKDLYSTLVNKEYTSVDDPIYRFCMEESEQLPGN